MRTGQVIALALALVLTLSYVAGAPQPVQRVQPLAQAAPLLMPPNRMPVAPNLRAKGEVEKATILPIVLWHGMGDTCCNDVSIGWVQHHLQKKYGACGNAVTTRRGKWMNLHPLSATLYKGTNSKNPAPLTA